jgi:hypothetical protein
MGVHSGINPLHRRRRVPGEVNPPPECQSTPRPSSPDNNNNIFDLYSALSTNVIKGAGVTSKAGISQQQMQGKINEFLSRNKIC